MMAAIVGVLLIVALLVMVIGAYKIVSTYLRPGNEMKAEAVSYAKGLHAIEMAQRWAKLTTELEGPPALERGKAQSPLTEVNISGTLHTDDLVPNVPVRPDRTLSRSDREVIQHYKALAEDRGLRDPFPQFDEHGYRGLE